MATKATGQSAGGIKIPDTLTIKDLITIISVAVSLTIAWGVFSTRIAIMEKEILALQVQGDRHASSVDRLKQDVRRLENHQQDDELLLDQVYSLLRKPAPIRRAEK